MRTSELQTPALVIDADGLDHNIATMAAALPGPRLRPHVKAHKCTSLARRQADAGHRTFTCATIGEVGAWPRPASAATCCWPTRGSTRPGPARSPPAAR